MGALATLLPAAFFTTTVIVYVVPFTRPVIVALVAAAPGATVFVGSAAHRDRRHGVARDRAPSVGREFLPDCHVTVALALPGVAATPVGASGTVRGVAVVDTVAARLVRRGDLERVGHAVRETGDRRGEFPAGMTTGAGAPGPSVVTV